MIDLVEDQQEDGLMT